MARNISTLRVGQRCPKCKKAIWVDADSQYALLLFSNQTGDEDVTKKLLAESLAVHLLDECEGADDEG